MIDIGCGGGMLVIKHNESDNLSCCGVYLSVSSEYCGVAGILKKGRILPELGYFKSGVVELYKMSWCRFVE